MLLLGVAGGGDRGSSEHVMQNVTIGMGGGGVYDEGRVLPNSLGVDPEGGRSRN